MNKTQKKLLPSFAIGAIQLFASCNETDDITLSQKHLQTKARLNSVEYMTFKVNNKLLKKYLSIKKKTPLKITPIVIDNDTLAYKVDFVKGWELISGDQRLSPIMAQSDKELDMSSPNDPNTACVIGQLNYIREIRNSGKKEKNTIWELLDNRDSYLKKKTSRKIKTRGIGKGMWIPTDTTFATQSRDYPHVITTSWHQGYPYNIFCPIVTDSNNQLTHAPVGCIPIAVGQVIYHYRKNNNRDIPIPTSATGPTPTNKAQFGINSLSATGWEYLSSNTYYVAMFLRDLGKKMQTTYKASSSGTKANEISVMQTDYFLAYSEKKEYNYNLMIQYLRNRQPVIIAAKNSNGETGHFFIVDGYKEVCESMVIRYEWDENHIITDEEFIRYPQDIFEPDPKGDTERFVEELSDINTYITMNWGWQTPNTTWYIAHEYSAPYEVSDFAGSFTRPERNYTYSPYWTSAGGTYNSVAYMFYNFQEFYPGKDNTGEFVP